MPDHTTPVPDEVLLAIARDNPPTPGFSMYGFGSATLGSLARELLALRAAARALLSDGCFTAVADYGDGESGGGMCSLCESQAPGGAFADVEHDNECPAGMFRALLPEHKEPPK